MRRPFEHECLDCQAHWFDSQPRWAWCKVCSHEVVVSRLRDTGERVGEWPEQEPEGPPPSNVKTWEEWRDGDASV